MDRQSTSVGGQEVPEGAQEWLSMLQGLAEQIQKQQQNSQQMVQDMMNTYVQLLNIPGSYMSEQAQQQQQVFQQTVQQWMQQAQEQQQTFQQQAQEQQQAFQQMFQESANTFMQLFNIPATYAQEGLRTAQEDTPGGAAPGNPQQAIQEVIRETNRMSRGQ